MNNNNWGKIEPKEPTYFVCVDGLQRYTAVYRFVNNEIKAFGHYYREFEGSPRLIKGLNVNVNNLQTRREVLEWYLQLNTGGTVHSKEEIERVKELLRLEIEKS